MKRGQRFFLHASAALAVLSIATPSRSAEDPASWATPVKPFRIAGNIYYVGTEGLAAYLIVSPKGAILLEGTTRENATLIERNIGSLGVPLKQVKLLISDHAHYDHVGALAQIKRDTGARFLASVGDRWALENGRPRGETDYGVRPFPAVKVDGTVADGQTIRLGDIALTAHLTPGHTPGCTSWSMVVRDGATTRRVLFLGSITVAGNILVGNRAYPGIAADFRRTFTKLAGMKADIVLPSHPEMADILGKERRREEGKADAFVNRTELPLIVARAHKVFEESLAAAKTRRR